MSPRLASTVFLHARDSALFPRKCSSNERNKAIPGTTSGYEENFSGNQGDPIKGSSRKKGSQVKYERARVWRVRKYFMASVKRLGF